MFWINLFLAKFATQFNEKMWGIPMHYVAYLFGLAIVWRMNEKEMVAHLFSFLKTGLALFQSIRQVENSFYKLIAQATATKSAITNFKKKLCALIGKNEKSIELQD